MISLTPSTAVPFASRARHPVPAAEKLVQPLKAQSVSLPVYGLGGVGRDNAASLIGSGACGLAGVGAIAAALAAPSIRT